jgi:hypothetical protein
MVTPACKSPLRHSGLWIGFWQIVHMYEQFSQTGLPSERRSRFVLCSTKFFRRCPYRRRILPCRLLPMPFLLEQDRGAHLRSRGRLAIGLRSTTTPAFAILARSPLRFCMSPSPPVRPLPRQPGGSSSIPSEGRSDLMDAPTDSIATSSCRARRSRSRRRSTEQGPSRYRVAIYDHPCFRFHVSQEVPARSRPKADQTSWTLPPTPSQFTHARVVSRETLEES